ncbi:response regulator [Chitinophaga horti]|uniref:Response regulator n=1 Tax=Chitinophaga horti TaxID=2920382 RepID=A0ABY6J7P8_9BACT|nr:response regulator [Chitinophaga horti]UYQ95704.1 response regulator [Chitinophaga horti]
MKTKLTKHNPVVLYVEDDEDDLYLLRQAVGQLELPYEVVHARNSEIAMAWLVSSAMSGLSPCLILMDFNLPTMNGMEATRLIRNIESFGKTPVVIYTTAEPQLLSSAMVPVLKKGGTPREIRNDVRQLARMIASGSCEM